MLHKSKLSLLSDLIDRLEWSAIETNYRRRGYPTMNEEDLFVIFEPSNKKKYPDKIDQVRLRIGKKIMKQLEWQVGDKILPLFNPDDQLFFLLVKSDHGKGYKLGNESNLNISKLSFKWGGDYPLLEPANVKVDYEIYKKQLLFKM